MDSINGKLNRGDEHFRLLNQEYSAWKEGAPWNLTPERSPDARRFVLGIQFKSLPDFLRWGLILGEALYNYRCALDYMVYWLAQIQSGEDPPPGHQRLAFPITSSDEAFQRSRNKLGELSIPVQTAIEELQPYASDGDVAEHPLSRLRELNDQDKHRVLQVVAFSLQTAEFEFEGLESSEVLISINDQVLAESDWLAAFTFPEPHLGPDLAASMSVRLALVDEPVPRKAVLEVLSGIRQAVLNSVNILKEFESN